jgi:hypothetical protein
MKSLPHLSIYILVVLILVALLAMGTSPASAATGPSTHGKCAQGHLNYFTGQCVGGHKQGAHHAKNGGKHKPHKGKHKPHKGKHKGQKGKHKGHKKGKNKQHLVPIS